VFVLVLLSRCCVLGYRLASSSNSNSSSNSRMADSATGGSSRKATNGKAKAVVVDVVSGDDSDAEETNAGATIVTVYDSSDDSSSSSSDSGMSESESDGKLGSRDGDGDGGGSSSASSSQKYLAPPDAKKRKVEAVDEQGAFERILSTNDLSLFIQINPSRNIVIAHVFPVSAIHVRKSTLTCHANADSLGWVIAVVNLKGGFCNYKLDFVVKSDRSI
jgi:hypothetical protein